MANVALSNPKLETQLAYMETLLPKKDNCMLTDINYFRDPSDWSKDVLTITYKDSSGVKDVHVIREPKLPVFFEKEEHQNYDYNKSSELLENTDCKFIPYSNLEGGMVKYMDKNSKAFFNKCIMTKQYNAISKLHQDPYVFGSDIDITVPYKMAWLMKKPKPSKSTIDKMFLDIEVDTYNISGFPEPGQCPIDIVTIVDEKTRTSHTFILRTEDNPQIKEFEDNVSSFVDELHEEFDEIYPGFQYKIYMFDEELDLIKAFLSLINTLKRDFLLIWNIRFDAPYIIERLKKLGVDPAKYMCHIDFPIPVCNFIQTDDKNKTIAGRGDRLELSSYTKWYCQMKLYSGIRKGQKELRSNALTDVAREEIGDEKYNYEEDSNIKTLSRRNFRQYVKYNIKDVLLQYGVERKVQDVDAMYERCYSNISPLDMIFKQTITLKNRVYMEYLIQGYIMGNTIPSEPVSYEGGLVGNPLLNNYRGQTILGRYSMFVFKNVIDFDFSSMYPNMMVAFNIERCTMIGKVFIPDGVFKELYYHFFDEEKEYYKKNKRLKDSIYDEDEELESKFVYDAGADFLENYNASDPLSFGTRWYHLPTYDEILDECRATGFSDTNTYTVEYTFEFKWIKAVGKLLSKYFGVDRGVAEARAHHIFNTKVQDTECFIHNNYIKKSVKSSLLKLSNYIDTKKPIIAGNGVLFKNQNQVYNPLATTIMKFMKSRKEFKSQLAKIEDKNSYEYRTFDRLQLTEKIMANSLYGASGASWSFLYNTYTAPAITRTGRSLISTANLAFESFLGDNVKFNIMNEFYAFIYNIMEEKYEIDDSFLPKISRQELANRLYNNFFRPTEEIRMKVFDYVNKIPEKYIARIYYKNNLYEFSRIPVISTIIGKIVSTPSEFKNPNRVPDSIKEYLNDLWDMYKQFVLYNHLYMDKVYRTRNEYRNSVVVIDTDSNMINVDHWNEFVKNEIIPKYTNGLSSENKNEQMFININTMAYVATNMITAVLNTYTEKANLLPEYQKMINMKNEFLLSIMVTAEAKKRYITNILLREGDFLPGGKLDIKGYDFIKSATSKDVSEKFKTIIKECIIKPEVPDIPNMIYRIHSMENDIAKSLRGGDKEFYIPKSVKEPDAYEFPLRQQGFRGVLYWNMLYPEQQMSLPIKTDIVKMTLTNTSKLNELKLKYPDIYQKVDELILSNKDKDISGKKLYVIAIPRSVDKAPDWILDFIDIDDMTNSITKQFYPILGTMNCTVTKTSNRSYFSNILSF